VYNLMRNIGGSFGIAVVTTLLARGAQVNQDHLISRLSLENPILQRSIQALNHVTAASGPITSELQAYGILYSQVIRQATLLAYTDNFRLLAGLAAICVPLVLVFRKQHKSRAAKA
jgi:DHA2 family multidrug resistance protein